MTNVNHAHRVRPLILLGVVLLVNGCGEDLLCPGTRNRSAVTVVVTDLLTGEPAVEGATGLVRDGGFVDTLRGSTQNSNLVPTAMAGAIDRPGVYAVEIHKDGYLEWRRDGVDVREGACGVEGKLLEARLQRM